MTDKSSASPATRDGNEYRVEFDETGGYDCMTGGFAIVRQNGDIAAEVDLRHYGQKPCDYDGSSFVDAKERAEAVAHRVCAAINASVPSEIAPKGQHLAIDLEKAFRFIDKLAAVIAATHPDAFKGWARGENAPYELAKEAVAFVYQPRSVSAPSAIREKFIRCVWVVERQFGYGKAMRVVASDHPRFSVGTRFDFGFLDIATKEGYRVQIDPVPPHVIHDMEEASRERKRTV